MILHLSVNRTWSDSSTAVTHSGKKASVKRERNGAGKQPKAKKEKTEWDVIHGIARDNMHAELLMHLPNKEDYA